MLDRYLRDRTAWLFGLCLPFFIVGAIVVNSKKVDLKEIQSYCRGVPVTLHPNDPSIKAGLKAASAELVTLVIRRDGGGQNQRYAASFFSYGTCIGTMDGYVGFEKDIQLDPMALTEVIIELEPTAPSITIIE